MEEGTYSLIFTSLKHPIRRRILRMLADKPLTFSEILESLSIDSGHLSYHLESFGDLIAHAQDGKYQLSSIGVAAVKLMGGVEEHPPESSRRKVKLSQVVANVYPLILAAALIVASLYFITYTTPVSTAAPQQDYMKHYPFFISAGQTLEVNVKVIYRQVYDNTLIGVNVFVDRFVNGTHTVERQPPPACNTVTAWETGTMWLDLKLNMNASTPIQTEPPFVIAMDMPPHSNLSVAVYKPDGTMSTYGFDWVSLTGGINHLTSPHVEITQPGTYRFMIKNNDSHDWVGVLTPNAEWQLMEIPYFYYGIAGFAIALGYLVLIASWLLWRFRKAKVKMPHHLSAQDTAT
jgi:DNA-binding transcriptional ArsR family regulator